MATDWLRLPRLKLRNDVGPWRPVANALVGTSVVMSVLAITLGLLYGFAVLSYIVVYNEYIPTQVRTVPVHLQYGYDINPYGMADLRGLRLMANQDYDVKVTLAIPRSPQNLDRGNFMLELKLLNQGSTGFPLPITVAPATKEQLPETSVILTTTRPVLVPYTDPFVALASKALFILYHVLYPFADRQTLDVTVIERTVFGQLSGTPNALYLELTAGQTFQTYSAEVSFVAQLSGLKWLMYHHRFLGFFLFTWTFWLCEIFFMLATTGLVMAYLGRGTPTSTALIPTDGQPLWDDTTPPPDSELTSVGESRKGQKRIEDQSPLPVRKVRRIQAPVDDSSQSQTREQLNIRTDGTSESQDTPRKGGTLQNLKLANRQQVTQQQHDHGQGSGQSSTEGTGSNSKPASSGERLSEERDAASADDPPATPRASGADLSTIEEESSIVDDSQTEGGTPRKSPWPEEDLEYIE